MNDNTVRSLDDAPEDDDALYTDENGIPMLFDVVVPGDYLKAAGTLLDRADGPSSNAPSTADPQPDQARIIRERVEQAVEAALPRALDRAARVIRESLSEEIERALAADDRPDRDAE